MADKTTTPDISVRAIFAIVQGALIAMSLPMMYAFFPDAVRNMLWLFLFILIPVFSFLTSMFLNWFLQYMYCGSVNVNTISLGASFSPMLVVLLSVVSYFLPFLRTPVTQLISELPQESPEEAKFARELWGYVFYIFWAGLYGQTVASGMVAACA
jgi:Zn-dependent protease